VVDAVLVLLTLVLDAEGRYPEVLQERRVIRARAERADGQITAARGDAGCARLLLGHIPLIARVFLVSLHQHPCAQPCL
jgi:hypothetical protein